MTDGEIESSRGITGPPYEGDYRACGKFCYFSITN